MQHTAMTRQALPTTALMQACCIKASPRDACTHTTPPQDMLNPKNLFKACSTGVCRILAAQRIQSPYTKDLNEIDQNLRTSNA